MQEILDELQSIMLLSNLLEDTKISVCDRIKRPDSMLTLLKKT